MHALFLLQHQSFNPYFVYLYYCIYFFIVEERSIQKFFYFYLGDIFKWIFMILIQQHLTGILEYTQLELISKKLYIIVQI